MVLYQGSEHVIEATWSRFSDIHAHLQRGLGGLAQSYFCDQSECQNKSSSLVSDSDCTSPRVIATLTFSEYSKAPLVARAGKLYGMRSLPTNTK